MLVTISNDNPTSFRELTTLGVGGPIQDYRRCHQEAEMIACVREADAEAIPFLILGGGSNLLVSDTGFAGICAQDSRYEITTLGSTAKGDMRIEVSAGHHWDTLVALTLEMKLSGLEVLSGIPGTVGGAVVQNIGAYGREIGSYVESVRVWDRQQNCLTELSAAELHFGYRRSILKPRPQESLTQPTGRFVVLSVILALHPTELSQPLQYQELLNYLEISNDAREPAMTVRDAVLELRRHKGMLYDPKDADTCSAGSFFTNPILSLQAARDLPDAAPRYPEPSKPQHIKTSAAWLIEHAGFSKGFSLPESAGRASLSHKHCLALTNRGGALSEDILALARHIRQGVADRFAILLEPEPIFVNCQLD